MEDVLDVYQLPYNEDIPVVCMDEKPQQLLGERFTPLPIKPRSIKKTDYAYLKNGTCCIFMFVEPLAGFRYTIACETRKKVDWACQIDYLLTKVYPDKKKIVLVLDNLNTHTIAALYETFPAPKALALAKRLEIHHTPKHGSWLNIAEIELSALTKQCLSTRSGSLGELNDRLTSWNTNRNTHHHHVNWQFTTDDARVKLKRLYPQF
jgi:hypothetical protein